MISYGKNAENDGRLVAVYDLKGLSTDTKPTNVGNGSCFIEMDTKKIFFYDAENEQWIEF